MSSLDKLLKAFESVRLASTSGVQNTGMKLKKNGPEHTSVELSNLAQSSVSLDEPKSILDQSKSMASFASSLSQQGQNFLSKKEMLLSSRDKLSLCHSVMESIISGLKANSVDFQKLISIGIETLIVLIDDENPDVRMNADEALNRVIRCLSENHIGKIQLELFKEIKKNGPCRCLKAALIRFALLCHHIRPQKCRAYVQNLIPLLNIISKRTEESLQEAITLSFEKILPILGHFTNDNEIRNLLKAFLPNVTHISPSMRRSAVSCLVLLCQHSRKPYFFFLWILEIIIDSLLPQQEELPSHQVMGGLLLIRSLAPYFDVLCTANKSQMDYNKEKLRGAELVMSYDQAIQVFEICLYYCSSSDHNVVAASLEALQSLLQNPCQHLLIALTSPEGITRSRIKGEKLPKFTSRNCSEISIATMGLEEDSLENMELSSLICQDEDLSNMSQSFRKSVAVTPDEKTFDRSMSLESSDPIQEIPTLLHSGPGNPDKAINFDGNPLAEDGLSTTSILSGCASTDEACKKTEVEGRSSSYSEIEIGQLSDTSLLFGRRDVDEESKSRSKKKNTMEEIIKQEGFTVSEERVKIQGNIGSFFDEDLPVKYLVRYISSSFLLSGHPTTVISDKVVKVSIKVLALNCIGYAISWHPSFFAETLYIPDNEEGSSLDVQYIYDILRYSLHSDPQLRWSIAVLVGQFIHSCLISNGGIYTYYGLSELNLDTLLDLLCNLLHHNSSVTVRGALAGLNICLPELLHSSHCSKVAIVVRHFLKVTTNSYWLVKVDLCDLLSHLNLQYLDHIEGKALHIRINLSKEKTFQNFDKFSHEIVSSIFIPLLSDEDRRVRSAATNAVSSLVPALLSEGDTVLKSCSQFILTDLFTVASSMERYQLDDSSKINSSVSLRLAPPPFDQVVDQETVKNVNHSGVKYLYWRNVDDNLSRLVSVLTTKLIMCNNKYLRVGILESLAQLCLDIPPTLHPHAWDCHILARSHISCSETEKGCHLGLVTLLLSLAGESTIAGDLSAQQFILTICTNWLAGRAVLLLRQTSGEHIRERKQAWVFLQNPQLSHVAESLLQHILRILCVYTHLLEGVTPSTRSILVPIGPAAVLSPIKRKSPLSAAGDKYKANTSGISSEKLDLDEKDKKNKSSFKGSFAHLPEYIKLYDILKNAHTNYKMTLDESAKEKFCDLLRHTLKGLGIILELAGMGEFGRVAEELLQYFRVTISILPTETIFCGQQLLKCLFGSNVVALWDHVFLDGPSKSAPQSESEIDHLPPLHKDRSASMYSLVFETPLSHLKHEFKSLHEGQMETLSLGQLKKRGSFLRLQAKATDKVSLSSYIRLFEPLVIKALKLYTISSDVMMQRSVLELLIHLVQIRVNYCLLDSEQIFIGYVIKQFEYIEEGQIKNASHIIPSMFSFLVLLSYERHHSKSIIGVPKIIQLCDGLMASGQHPLSHCVQALRPLVEDLFLERSYNSLVDQKELETQREVICSMLLRLVHYHQVVQLLSLVLISTHATNKDRWRKLSRQILDILLPLISKLQVNIESKQALTSLEELLGRVCPSVFRPPDPFLKALLTSPSEIETTEDVERWVGGILLLLRVLISLSSIDMILARLEHLGLCMDYTISDSDKSMSSSLHLALSPKRYCKVEKDLTSQSNFIDPLNVTQPSVQPQVALARFLLEVIRVGIDELRSLEFTKLQRTIFSESSQLKPTPELLDHLVYSFLLTVIHLAESGQWTPVMNSFKDLLHTLPEIVEEISDRLIFLSRWHPSLVVRWCELLSKIDFPIPSLWTKVLLTNHKKSASPSKDATSPIENIHQSMCLSVEFVRRNGLLIFSDFVLRHNQEGEWLPWLVVQHIKDIVLMYNELPIKALLQGIYASSSASALLIQAFHARCNLVHKAKYGVNVISIVSDIHKAQSGALVIFLIDRMLATAYLMIGRLAATLCTQRLQVMLAEKDSGHLYLSGNDLTKLISKMKDWNLDKRYSQVYSLLHQVANAQQLEGFSMSPTETCSFTSPSNTLLNLNWYLQLVRTRCRSSEGGSQECSELLSCLDYDDALLIMSSKHFNLSLLPNAFRHSLMDTLKANRNWIETSGSAEAEDSSDCSSVNEVGSECPLLTACKMVLRQHLSKIVAIVPYPHAIFVPNSSNKYSSKLCKAFLSNEAVVKLVKVLSPSVTEMMTSLTSLPWQVKFDAEILEILTSFAVLNIELLHFLAYHKLLSVSIMSNCLKSVDLLLQNQEVFALMCSGEKKSCIQSFVSSLHFIALYWIKPKGFPSLPANIRETLKGDIDSLQETCVNLMELIMWLEKDGLRDIPTCLSLPIRGLVIALGRSPILNAIVRTPPELWVLAWSPTLISTSCSIMLPPVPADLFHESEVLKQFIFRLNLLGFIGRQQFEETWMQFLSVLNITLNAETPVEEIPYINLSISLAVRGVTSLLVQTMLLPCPGNPHNSKLLSVAKDKPPNYLTTLRGQKLQNMMRLLHLKLGDVQHITKGGSKHHLNSLHPGQISVDYLVAAIADSQVEVDMLASYEFEMRKKQLESVGLDVESCIHFLHYLYSSWLNPPNVLCSSVIAEVVKSLSVLCDLFTSASHHRWILETLIPLHASHPVEDFITFQYVIIATCKALATLKSAQEEVSTLLSEGVLHIVENGLRSIQVSVRTCSLYGILYLLQAPLEESSPIISLAANYILKCKDGKSPECEGHEVALWEMWVYLVEHYKIGTHPTLPSTALHMALSTAASSCTSPRILHLVLRGVERLILVQQITTGTIEVILKLVMDLILNCSPAVSLPALPLFVTALHSSIRIQDGTNLGQNRDVEQSSKYPEDNSSDPEVILQYMEKLSILFDRIRVGYPFEAEVIAGLLGPCLLDMLPASQILNKVITEYISSHQPHPHLLASTLFQVFEAAMNEGGQTLVQEWVLLSLSNFTQRTPVSLAIWCLTCFFIAASNNRWLRSAFPSVQARLGKMEANDIQIFCLAAIYFRRSLDTELQRRKFDDAFQSAATSQGFPFDKLLNYLNEEKKK